MRFDWAKTNFITLGWLFCHGVSSICLFLINRHVGIQYPYLFHVILFQNAFSFLLGIPLIQLGILPINSIKVRHLVECLPSTIAFVLMLWSSLQCLVRTSISVVIIIRNFTPICLALLESRLFGIYFSLGSYAALGLVSLGTVIFFFRAMSFSRGDLAWMTLYAFLCISLPILEKATYRRLQQEQTSAGIFLYRNGLSIMVILFAIVFGTGGPGGLFQGFIVLFGLSWTTVVFLALSCIAGFMISLAYFFLVTLIPVTYLSVANGFYKLCSLATSLLVWKADFSIQRTVGLLLSFIGIFVFIPLQSKSTSSSRLQKDRSNENTTV
jgi:hypothetical protein